MNPVIEVVVRALVGAFAGALVAIWSLTPRRNYER